MRDLWDWLPGKTRLGLVCALLIFLSLAVVVGYVTHATVLRALSGTSVAQRAPRRPRSSRM
jgi:hypothetical protein